MRAAEREQLLGVRQRFDAFGDEPHAELVGQLHDRAADGAAVVGRSHARDERPIQLERVDRIALQRAQRRIAGAEVVEVHRHLDVVQPFDRSRPARHAAGVVGVRRAEAGRAGADARRSRSRRRRAGDPPRAVADRSLGRRPRAAPRAAPAPARRRGRAPASRGSSAAPARPLTAGAATLTVLNPPDPDWERQKVRNDDSIVLEVRVGDVAFILPGDITRAVEPDVVQRLVPAPLVIVKAPHHGSAGSSSPSFVDATHPAAVIFSAGRRNPFGHPAPVVVERYKAAGAAVFSTADDGAVVVDTDGAKVTIWTWNGRRLLLNAPSELTPTSNHATEHAPTANHKDH